MANKLWKTGVSFSSNHKIQIKTTGIILIHHIGKKKIKMLIITSVAECLAKKLSRKSMQFVVIILKSNLARSGKIVEITP